MRVLILLCLSLSLFASEELLTDQWYSGTFNGQPALNAHLTVTGHDDGSRTSAFTMNIIISRGIGQVASALEMKQYRSFTEDADGSIRSFRFHDDQNGQRMVAEGVVLEDQVVATIARSGRTHEQTVPIPDDVELMGQQRSQELLANADWAVGESMTFHGVELLMGRLYLIETEATLLRRTDEGNLVCSMAIDLMPGAQTEVELTAQGDLVTMAVTMGPLTFSLEPSDGPTPIEAAQLDILGLMKRQGPAPRAIGPNRYRLPDQAQDVVMEDAFQHFDENGLLVVRDTAEASVPADTASLLAAEPQLEIADPALQQWVDELLEGHAAESTDERIHRLTRAVRAHIIHKDLSQGDATALETFHSRRGDCTEHANLACAVLRAAGIPARTEVGFVFAPDFGTWVGHAWAMAWDGERWRLVDAAYPGIRRSSYIKAGVSSNADQGTGAAMMRCTTTLLGESIEVVPLP